MSKNASSHDPRQQAQELLIRYKIYDGLFVVLLFFGVVVFFMFYQKMAHGDFRAFLKNPALLLMLFSPFVPAAFFSFLSSKKKKQLEKLAYLNQNSPTGHGSATKK